MAVNDERPVGEKETWRRYAGSIRRDTESSCPDANVLAAYMDGCATDAERDMVDRHLAACDACLQVVTEVRALARAEAPGEVPGDVVFRAMALVRGSQVTSDREPFRLFRVFSQAARWAAAAAAILAACVAGYELGASTCLEKNMIDDMLYADLAVGVSDLHGPDPGGSAPIDVTSGGAK